MEKSVGIGQVYSSNPHALLKKDAGRGGDTPGNLRRSTGCYQHGGDMLASKSGDGHLFYQ